MKEKDGIDAVPAEARTASISTSTLISDMSAEKSIKISIRLKRSYQFSGQPVFFSIWKRTHTQSRSRATANVLRPERGSHKSAQGTALGTGGRPARRDHTKPRSRVLIHLYSTNFAFRRYLVRKKDPISQLKSFQGLTMWLLMVFFGSFGAPRSPPASAPDRPSVCAPPNSARRGT
jgi:hypothetical protein